MTNLSDSSNSDPLDAVVADYLQKAEAGLPPDRDAIVGAHPELAERLRAFFADLDRMGSRGESFRLPDVALPEDFGDYEFLGEIGRGGMGVVYRVRQKSLDRVVALKMILSGPLADASALRRFREEAEVLSRLDHPNIVPVYEVGEHRGLPFFTMKLIEGTALTGRLDQYLGDRTGAAELLAKVCDAIDHAHQRGVLHRDLKPGNILVDAAGEPHVTDFGLSRQLEEARTLTSTGAILGTPEYMAPEQAAGGKDVTTAVDVYSLGAVFYALLTNRPPFRAETAYATVRQVVEELPLPPRKRRRTTPRDLDTICMKCLEKSPARRYSSAKELAAELRRWVAGKPILTRPSGRVARVLKWARRRPTAAALVCTSCVAGVVVVVGAIALAIQSAQLSTSLQDARTQRGLAEERATVLGQQAEEITDKSRQLSEKVSALERSQYDLHMTAYTATVGLAERIRREGNPLGMLEQLDACGWNVRGWEHDHLTLHADPPVFAWSQSLIASHSRPLLSHDGSHLVGWYRTKESETPTITAIDIDRGVAVNWPKDEVPERLTKVGIKLDAAGIPALLDKPSWSLRLGTEKNWLAVVHATTGQVRCELDMPPPEAGELIRAGREKPKDFDTRTWRTECAISFDGTLVAGAQEGELLLWSGWTGKILVRRKLHDARITAIGFRRGDNLLATVDYDRKKLSLTDPYTGRLVRTIQCDNSPFSGIVNHLTFSGDGSRIQVGTAVWNVRAPEPVIALPTQCDSPTGFAFARSAKKVIYSGSDERFAQPRAVLQIGPVLPPQDRYPAYPHPFQPLRGASHDGKVNAVDISADGKVVATGGVDGTVRIWQSELVEQGELVREWDGHQDRVTTTGFSPGGEWCFTGTERELIAWDAATLKERFRCTLPKDHKGAEVLFAPDGKRFFWGGCLWQANDGAKLHTLEGSSAAFTPKGDRIATFGCPKKPWVIWDTGSGKKVFVSKQETQVMGAFLPDGNTLLTCQVEELWADGRQCVIWLFDVAANKWIGMVRIAAGSGEFAHLHRVAVSPDGKQIALTARMQRMSNIPHPQWRSQFVWDAAKLIARAKMYDTKKEFGPPKLELGEALLDLTKTFGATNEIVWDPNGPLLHYRPNYWGHDPFTSGLDPSRWILVVRNRGTGKEQPVEAVEKVLVPDSERVIMKNDGNDTRDIWFHGSAAISPDGRTVISSGFWKGKVKVWRIADTHTRGILKGHKEPVHAVALSPDARTIASAGADGTVRLWDGDGKQLRVLEAHVGGALAVVFSPDGGTIATAGTDSLVRLWDAKTGKPLRDLSGHKAPVRGLSYSPDGKQLASASDDHTVRLWNADTGDSQRVITGHIGPVRCVAFDTEGRLLASGGRDGTVRLWGIDGKAITSLQLHKDSVCGVVWTGLDYAPLLSISDDQTLRRWKKNDTGVWAEVEQSMRVLSRGRVECQAISPAPDGRHVYATDQGTVVVWDLQTKKIVRTIGGPDSRELIMVSERQTGGDNRPIWTMPLGDRWDVVTASPDGKYLAVMSRNWWCLCDVLDAQTGESIWYRNGRVGSKSPLLGPGSGAPTTAPVFSPDGKHLLVWNTLLDVQTGAEVRTFRSPVGGGGWTSNTAWDRIQPFSPDGKLVALGGSPVGEKTPSVCIWNVETGELLQKLGTNPQNFSALAWSHDSSRIAIAYSGSTQLASDIQVFDARTGAEIATCSGSGMTDALVFTADGNRIISSHKSSGHGMNVWDARTGKPITRLPQYWRFPFDTGEYTPSTPGVNVFSDHWGAEMLAMNPQGSRLFGLREIYDHGTQIVAWDIPESPRPLALPFSANSFRLSPDRRFLLGDTQRIQWNVLNLTSGQSQRFQAEHARPMWFHPQSKVLHSADGRCIDPDSGRVLSRWHDGISREFYYPCAMTTDGQRIVSMQHYDSTHKSVRIQVHDPQGNVIGVCSSDVASTKPDSGGYWISLARAVFVPSVPCVLFAFPDNTIRAWKLPEEHATEQEAWKAAKPPVELFRCTGHTGMITDLGVSDDGTRMVSASEDGTVRVWNMADGTELRKFADHGGPVQRAAISADGKRVAAVGKDRRVIIWNADTGERVQSLEFPEARSFQFIGFINGGRELICVGDERWLRVWDVGSGRILRAPTQEK